jgi:hypothetical protein
MKSEKGLIRAGTLALALSFSFAGCAATDSQDRGPIDIRFLWKAWETTGWHPDLREKKAAVIVERFHTETEPIENPGTGPVSGTRRICDAYLCREKDADTCYLYQSYGAILGGDGDSVLNYTLFTVKDKRPILRLTEADLAYGYGSMRVNLTPSRRILADTNGGGLRIDWPKPVP